MNKKNERIEMMEAIMITLSAFSGFSSVVWTVKVLNDLIVRGEFFPFLVINTKDWLDAFFLLISLTIYITSLVICFRLDNRRS